MVHDAHTKLLTHKRVKIESQGKEKERKGKGKREEDLRDEVEALEDAVDI